MTASTKSKARKKELIKGPRTEVTGEVLDFIKALDDYKKSKNRPFPTWSEVLEVLKQLGYRQVESARPIEEIGEGPRDGCRSQSPRGGSKAATRTARPASGKASRKASKKASKKATEKGARKGSKKASRKSSRKGSRK